MSSMAHNLWKSCLCIGLCAALISVSSVPGVAERLSDRYDLLKEGETDVASPLRYYADVLAAAEREGYIPAQTDFPLQMEDAVLSEGGAPETISREGKSGIILQEDQSLKLSFTAPTDALYAIEVVYMVTGNPALPAKRGVLLDGKYSFREAQSIALYPYLALPETSSFDEAGNQLSTQAEADERWNTVRLRDADGGETEPLLWAISAGEHTLELQYADRAVTIASIRLCVPDKIPSYAEVKAGYNRTGYAPAKESRVMEAEQPGILCGLTDSTLLPYSDSDPKTTPVSEEKIVFNAIGGNSWSVGGQTLLYTLEVPENGLYQLTLRISQKWNNGMTSFRQIAVDGKVPFQEMLAYGFAFDRQWRNETLSDKDGEPFLFYMEKGRHILSLTMVQSSEISQTSRQAEIAGDELSALYRRILMVTGPSPDPNYEYELDKSILELNDTLGRLIDTLKAAGNTLALQTRGKSAADSHIKMIVQQLSDMKAKPKTIAWNLDNLTNAISSLGSLSVTLKKGPLALDNIRIDPPGTDTGSGRSGVIDRVSVLIRSFLQSFKQDYRVKSFDGRTVSVWISQGKEWASILSELIRSDFEVNTGIKVKLNILPSGSSSGTVNPLLLALTSGRGPDAALHMSADLPVEYGIRGAAADISTMPDFAEVASRFHPKLMKAFTFLDSVYGLPETMNFYVMIYRKDIFDQLGLTPPNTWDEVYYRILPKLYQNNLQMTPAPFDVYLYQMGGRVYSDDGLFTELDSPVAHAAFESTVNQYQDLGYPISFNFFNRFRTGEMPIGFVDYTGYLQMITAAPELMSKWALAPMPGTVQADGSIRRTTTTLAMTVDMVMQSAKAPDEAWEFLKWWSQPKIQAAYGQRLESVLGSGARWNPAAINAYDALPWSKADIKVFKKCWENTEVVPTVLGGAITTRALNNALYAALYDGVTPRRALEQAAEEIKKELQHKQELYKIYPETIREGTALESQ